MGKYFRRFVLYPLAFLGAASYCAFSLGARLPLAARRTGQSLGMGFNYFKAGLRILTEPAPPAGLSFGLRKLANCTQ